MGILIVKNQPVQALRNLDACSETKNMQLVQTNDTQRVQVRLSPHNETELISESTFSSGATWTLGGTATISGGKLNMTGATSAQSAAIGTLTAGVRYRVRFTVAFNTIDNSGGYRIKLNNQYVKLADASGGTYSIMQGTIDAYILVASLVNATLVIETTGVDTDVEFDSMSLMELSQAGLQVLDAEYNILDDYNDTYTTYEADSNIATVRLPWSSQTPGIVYWSIYDMLNYDTNIVLNGTFTGDLMWWTSTGSWNAGLDNAVTSGTDMGVLQQTITLPGGAKYDLQFTVTGLTPGVEALQVYYIVDNLGTYLSAIEEYATIGTKTLTIDLSEFTGVRDLVLNFKPKNASDVLTLDNVSLKRKLDTATITNPFKLAAKHFNTLLLYATNAHPAYGFNFNEFTMTMRLRADLEYKGYPDTTEVFRFSNASHDVLSSITDKLYDVRCKGMPEYMHDALRIIRLCDTFTIDGTAYVPDGEYNVNRQDKIHNAPAVFSVKEKQGIEENSY